MERTWERVGADQFGGEADRDAVRSRLGDIESIGHLVGGVFLLAPIRAQDPTTGEFKTIGWHMRWDSFAPAGRAADEAPVGDGEPEPVEDDR